MSFRKVILDTNVYIGWLNKLSARALGATVFTADQDYKVIRGVLDFDLEFVDA